MKLKDLIKKVLTRETILYIIFGAITTFVDFFMFWLLYYPVGINEVVANTIAWVVALIVAFVSNKIFVFEKKSTDNKDLLKEIVSFVLARVLSLIVADAFIAFAKLIGMNLMIAKGVISVVVVIMNYVFSKLYIFKK